MKNVLLNRASIAILGTMAFICSAPAASTPRDPAALSRARMPSMPISNISVTSVSKAQVVNPTNPTPTPDPIPDPKPDPQPDPQPDPEPDPEPECPDGGVRNSDYTVANCMQDVLHCVNGGGLPNGINDLFDEDVRHSVFNGMNLCYVQTEKCVETIRKNCKYVYKTPYDVWVDFNAREIQPAYYVFILQKTGLTPHQAQNTCELLDYNTYGTSFNAVSTSDIVTSEYNNQVGAYNSQPKNLTIKKNPMGAELNKGNPGVDGERGHYARWDAKNGECLIRVAAYNKDKQITNSWLFGTIGDDEWAQVWKPAGDTFTCNKDLFGFSLMNDTKTTAVVGVGGGTLLGAGIGALAGHRARAIDCSIASQRAKIKSLLTPKSITLLNNHIYSPITNNISEEQCEDILDLYNNAGCNKPQDRIQIVIETETTTAVKGNKSAVTQVLKEFNCDNATCATALSDEDKQKILQQLGDTCTSGINLSLAEYDAIFGKGDASLAYFIANGEPGNMGKSIGIGAATGATAGGLATAITAYLEKNNISCHLGDDLDRVALGKSYSIDTLRDFYIKWKLNLPDTILPTIMVSDCQSWQTACAKYRDLNQCINVQFNYKPDDSKSMTLIYTPCVASGSVCIANPVLTSSYGVCEDKK